MGWIHNSVVFFGSWAVFAGAVLWWYAEGGFEPWLLAVASLVGIAANRHLLPFGHPKPPRLTDEQRVAAREKWRPIFKNYFLESARDGTGGDCIVHDVRRLDLYPNADEDAKGISPWFRVGLMDTYERGVLLGLRWTYIVEQGDTWKEYQTHKPDGAVKVMLLGAVPYESIESVNFDGDEYYNKPHLFCHFEHNGGEPYERLFYGEEFQIDERFPPHYSEVAEFVAPSRPWWKFWKRGR
jgi:hypothetical protein